MIKKKFGIGDKAYSVLRICDSTWVMETAFVKEVIFDSGGVGYCFNGEKYRREDFEIDSLDRQAVAFFSNQKRAEEYILKMFREGGKQHMFVLE